MYTVFKQWVSNATGYHSSTKDYSDYDLAFAEMHHSIKPMINDTDVNSFTFTLFDNTGKKVEVPIKWVRQIVQETSEPTEPEENNEPTE